ncbi:MAG: DUF1109 family protein [Acidobacteria bacterium]|nr:DUF1109 family protein [Acidobacteriota bacterium]
MDTEQLIESLATGARPVTPLRTPWRRAAAWGAAAAAYVSALILLMPRGDGFQEQLGDPPFVVEQAVGLVTAIAAAAVALATTVPGHSPRLWLAPPVLVGTWIGAVALRAWADVHSAAPGALLLTSDWRCVAVIVIGASLPGAVLASMLRRGLPLTPRLTAGLGGLAAVSFGNLAACLQPHASNVVVLLWHGGTVLVLASVAALLGTRLLPWPSFRRSAALSG